MKIPVLSLIHLAGGIKRCKASVDCLLFDGAGGFGDCACELLRPAGFVDISRMWNFGLCGHEMYAVY